MSRLWLVLALVAASLIGCARIVWRMRRQQSQRKEVDNFASLLARYVQSSGRDYEAYGLMMERSGRVQELLGPVGIMAFYSAPFQRYTVRDYDIILNGLTAMRREFESGSRRIDHLPLVSDALLRYFGRCDDYQREKQGELRNPLVWLREGVATLLLLPLQLLEALGIVPASRAASFAHSAFVRVVAGVVAFVGLVASCIEWVLGLKPALAAVKQFLGY